MYLPPHKRRKLNTDSTIHTTTSEESSSDTLVASSSSTTTPAAAVQNASTRSSQLHSFQTLSSQIQSLINKTNSRNITHIIRHLFNLNLIRARGLLCQKIMRAQQGHGEIFTNVYAALIAVINTKMPEIGELLLNRLLIEFQRAYQRRDQRRCKSVLRFLAYLVNQQVAHVVLAGQICGLLLEQPTADSVELCVNLMKDCGKVMSDLAPKIAYAVFETFRSILVEGNIDKRVQYMIESLFAVRQSGFKDYPGISSEVDLVESRDQITHEVEIDDELDAQEELDEFQYDEDFEEHEERYQEIKREILGDDSASDEEDQEEITSGSNGILLGSSVSVTQSTQATTKRVTPLDLTDVSNVEVRKFKRDVYLMFASSLDHEECAFKIIKSHIADHRQMELCSMIISSCMEDRTYNKFFGLLAERFCFLDRIYQEKFEECFRLQYAMVENLDLTKLRNVAKLFAHLLEADALSWSVMQNIRLTAETTTIASRIFIKILFHELQERMGINQLKERLKNEYLVAYFEGLFPMDDPKNTKFAIHFWNSIGLEALTEDLQVFLDNAPQELLEDSDEDDSDALSSDDTSSEDAYTSSDDEGVPQNRQEVMFS